MSPRRWILGTAALSLSLTACGTTNNNHVSRPHSSAASYTPSQRAACPKGVLYYESAITPIRDVLLAAQRILARQRYGSQGTIYHLTPRNAPIDHVERLATGGASPIDQSTPGLIALHRAASFACGQTIAQASWAIHYSIPVSVIASAAGFRFLVKTRHGWQFWGDWCGTGKTSAWAKTYCP